MGRLLSGLGSLIAYLCVGTVIAVVIIVGYAVSKGFVDQKKLNDMLAIARGATLSSAADKISTGPAQPVQMLSVEERDQRSTTFTRHLELREQAVQNALEQIASEREKLLKERQSFDLLVAAFRKEKETVENSQEAKGQEDARAILENIKPKLAKDLILKMIAADEKDEVVAILSGMPIGKQTKIVQEFKTDEEQRKLDDILRRVRQGNNEAQSANTSAEPPAATEPRQPERRPCHRLRSTYGGPLSAPSSTAPPPTPTSRPQARFEDHLGKAGRPVQDDAPAAFTTAPAEQSTPYSDENPSNSSPTDGAPAQKPHDSDKLQNADREKSEADEQASVTASQVPQSTPAKQAIALADQAADLKASVVQGKAAKAKGKSIDKNGKSANPSPQQRSTRASSTDQSNKEQLPSKTPTVESDISTDSDSGSDDGDAQAQRSTIKESDTDLTAATKQNAVAADPAVVSATGTKAVESQNPNEITQTAAITSEAVTADDLQKPELLGGKRNRGSKSSENAAPAASPCSQLQGTSDTVPVSPLDVTEQTALDDAVTDQSAEKGDVGADATQPGHNDKAEPRAGTSPALLAARHEKAHEAIGRGDGLTEADRVRFVQRVANAFHSIGDNGGEIRLRLSPPELGALRIELSVRDGVLSARMETETSAARNLLLDNLPALRDRLADQNIKVERFDVDVRDDQRQSQHDLAGQGDLPQREQRQRFAHLRNPPACCRGRARAARLDNTKRPQPAQYRDLTTTLPEPIGMETNAISNQTPSAAGADDRNNALRGLDMDQFLKLMISELQNQDPLNPMENTEILQQISQIREIGATSRLTDTLDAVLLGQNLTSATSMIGKTVEALSDDAQTVRGVVDRVTVTDGDPRLHIGDQEIKLKNVKEVLPGAAT